MEKQRTPKNIFVQGAISPEKIAKSIANHQSKTDIGGHSIFLGQVRKDQKDNGTVVAIEYTAYEEMALQKAFEIREAIFAKYPLNCMHIYHSLGRVDAGQICLFVFTSSKHRRAAMDACDELVERIKAELPVWGKELLDSEEHVWKVNQ
ncbi:MAG: molybdenum cofactor biosynthesis protein MoaE [Algoriphagus sp.]|uniref:molybdenum cofactor biosynthesis protein MoaE n=1 Tax=Algoriphagus sp. TaxID=1872435 RepID=UPI0017AFEBE4|nr:molybdenum cofactor biosynthesis protein MoaE [Algoriphagus sp.]NVJ85283.1 molybdenum cofactor biosynthesis protein MoaE [Algoriphagus sp.]